MKKSGRKKNIDGISLRKKRTRATRSFHKAKPAVKIPLNVSTKPITRRRDLNIKLFSRKELLKNTPLYISKEVLPRRNRQIKKKIIHTIDKVFNHKITSLFIKIIIVVAAIFIFFNNRDRTTMTVRPHYQYLELSELIKVYKNPKEGDLGFDIIAITEEVTSSVIADEERPMLVKSSGEIIIYNNYSTEPQRLIPETRFKTAGGKIFFLGKEEVIIPGKVGDNIGSTTAMVYAEKAGEQYNIDTTDFSVPGFKESGLIDKYNGIYAVSTQMMEGGFIGSEAYVSENERLKAEQALSIDLVDRLRSRLNREKTENTFLVEGSEKYRFKESEYLSDALGSAGVLSQRGTILAIVVGNKFLGEYIADNYFEISDTESVKMLQYDDARLTLNNNTFDFENSDIAEINVSGSLLYVWNINKESLANNITNIKKRDLNRYLEDMISIDRASIKVRPFWRGVTSEDSNNIKIEVQ
jgi:hypothetical protein